MQANPGSAPQLRVGPNAFDGDKFQPPKHHVRMPGTLLLFNTMEDFKNADKNALLQAEGERIWLRANSEGKSDLCTFLMLVYCDLKKWQFYYWFAFPALPCAAKVECIAPISDAFDEVRLPSLRAAAEAMELRGDAAVLLTRDAATGLRVEEWSVGSLPSGSEAIALIADPSSLAEHPGWSLRNILLTLAVRCRRSAVRVLCYRDFVADGKRPSALRSIVIDVSIAQPVAAECPTAVGWEENARGKMGPRVVDLGPMMDPARLAEQAADLNLKLMRWRMLPELDVEMLGRTKCLLLGAGTLGCNVARCLMAWGVRKITFVDQGKVAYSNPPRQWLFDFDDCLDGGAQFPRAFTDRAELGQCCELLPRVV